MAKIKMEYDGSTITIQGKEDFVQRTLFGLINQHTNNVSVKKIGLRKPSYPTWADLKEAADEGRLADLLPDGCSVSPITLKNGAVMPIDVFRDENGKHYFAFHYLWGKHCMNRNMINAGGWDRSDMRHYIKCRTSESVSR